MRDAALSLALTHPFAGQLANPRQMTPYTYADSPIVQPDDEGIDAGPVPGRPAEARVATAFFPISSGMGSRW